jgi:hypothetical protein
MVNTAQRRRGDFGILMWSTLQERITMSDRNIHLIQNPAALQGNVKEKEGQATNNPELESEGKAIDLAISNSLFLAPRQELLEMKAELKRETEEGVAKPRKA